MKEKRLKRFFASIMTVILAVSTMLFGNNLDAYAVNMSDITDWVNVYPNNERNDYLQDQQTGSVPGYRW